MMTPNELEDWYTRLNAWLEPAYLAHDEPWKQSGMSGPADRWTALRKPVADCIDRAGSFLDIGCANGYLLECCLAWTAERGIKVVPYGLDLSARMIELAQKRLPEYTEHFFVGNALHWTPPQRFDFVRTELVYVPAEYEREYVERLRTHYLTPGGWLLIALYGEGASDPERGILAGCHPTRHLLERLAELGIPVIGSRDGYDAVKGRRTRVAIVPAGEV
ncbi:MAG: class I SAM-dependent methyltransferase [Chloroflexi bacterium]|nr:class I SAM-dependent methyltransferase [Chloroflexota bacterium]